jgi:hypothetical protein
MPYPLDTSITKSLLPCAAFSVVEKPSYLSGARDIWLSSGIPVQLGLAADLLAIELFAERIPGYSTECGPRNTAMFSIRMGGESAVREWSVDLRAIQGDQASYWSPLSKADIPRDASVAIYTAMSSAIQDAWALWHDAGSGDELVINYTTTWENLSNHQRLSLTALSHLPTDQVLRDRAASLHAA